MTNSDRKRSYTSRQMGTFELLPSSVDRKPWKQRRRAKRRTAEPDCCRIWRHGHPATIMRGAICGTGVSTVRSLRDSTVADPKLARLKGAKSAVQLKFSPYMAGKRRLDTA